MDEEQFKLRTKQLALRVIRLADSLPRTSTGEVLGRQILRSATSVGANYRAACRARSSADMASKLAIALEEADETSYWLELISASGLVPEDRLADLLRETNEITAMLVASLKTLRAPRPNQKSKI